MILTASIQSLVRTLAPCIILQLLVCLAVAAEPEANVCVRCHGGLPGRLGAPVAQWRGSVHAENGIFCNGCHGGDPKDAVNAMSPARGFLGVPKKDDIPVFCGRCHVGVLESFRTSAHGKATGKGGPTCVTCHANHRVRKATLDLINEKSCGSCHSFEGSRLIREAMAATESRIVALDRRIGGLKGKGVDTSRMEQRLFAGRNRFHTLSHVVDVNTIKGSTREINADLDSIDRSLKDIGEQEGKKKLMGAAAIAGALLAALLLTLYRRTFT
jgi:hypothetical protein